MISQRAFGLKDKRTCPPSGVPGSGGPGEFYWSEDSARHVWPELGGGGEADRPLRRSSHVATCLRGEGHKHIRLSVFVAPFLQAPTVFF